MGSDLENNLELKILIAFKLNFFMKIVDLTKFGIVVSSQIKFIMDPDPSTWEFLWPLKK